MQNVPGEGPSNEIRFEETLRNLSTVTTDAVSELLGKMRQDYANSESGFNLPHLEQYKGMLAKAVQVAYFLEWEVVGGNFESDVYGKLKLFTAEKNAISLLLLIENGVDINNAMLNLEVYYASDEYYIGSEEKEGLFSIIGFEDTVDCYKTYRRIVGEEGPEIDFVIGRTMYLTEMIDHLTDLEVATEDSLDKIKSQFD